MAVLNISDDDLALIREQASGASQTPEQYVAARVRADQRRRAKSDLEAMLLEGIESGPPEEWNAQDLDAMRREIREHASRQDAT